MAGATGLVGQAVVAALLADKSYSRIHTLGRRAIRVTDPRQVHHVVDFAALKDLPRVNDVFIALGTTIKVAGSQAAFRAIDFDTVVAVARISSTQGATKLGVVSAMGADTKSKVFYNRVKGDMESAVSKLGYKLVVIARPSLLTGDRSGLAQPQRLGEKLGLAAAKLWAPVIPANYKPVSAIQVAKALVTAVGAGQKGVHVMLSGQLQQA